MVSPDATISVRTCGTVRRSRSMRCRLHAIPKRASNTRIVSTNPTTCPSEPMPPRSLAVIVSIVDGRIGLAQGLPVWAAWSANDDSHGTNANDPMPIATSTRTAAGLVLVFRSRSAINTTVAATRYSAQ